MSDEVYLGDGLHAGLDAYGSITLHTERADGRHFVVLEPQVLAAFETWLRDLRKKAGAR